MQETWVQFLGRQDPLEKEMATHSSILAWRIPETIKLAHRFSAMGLSEEACRNLLYAGANSSLSQTLSHLL